MRKRAGSCLHSSHIQWNLHHFWITLKNNTWATSTTTVTIWAKCKKKHRFWANLLSQNMILPIRARAQALLSNARYQVVFQARNRWLCKRISMVFFFLFPFSHNYLSTRRCKMIQPREKKKNSLNTHCQSRWTVRVEKFKSTLPLLLENGKLHYATVYWFIQWEKVFSTLAHECETSWMPSVGVAKIRFVRINFAQLLIADGSWSK